MIRAIDGFCLLVLLVGVGQVRAGFQTRELENAGALLYMSFDNGSGADYWRGQPPLAHAQAQIASGALGNGCLSPQLQLDATGNLLSSQGTIAFFARLGNQSGPFMTVGCKEATLNQWMLILHRAGHWLRPWRLNAQGHAIGREVDVTALDMTRWHHFALVWDHRHGVKFYVDGQLASSQWGTHGWQQPLTPTTITFVPKHGIDELWIFDHPLQSSQITALLQGQLIAQTPEVSSVNVPGNTSPSRLTKRPSPRHARSYTGTIPRWAQQTRWLVQRCQKRFGTKDLFRFDEASPVRLVDGFHAWQQHQKGQLASLWTWYTRTATSNLAPQIPQEPVASAREEATRYLNRLHKGGSPQAMGQQAILEAWLQTGEPRFLRGMIDSALADDDAFGWTVLSTLFCRGKLYRPGWPKVDSPWVTWEDLGPHVIAKINRAESGSLQISLFNFTHQTQHVVLRPWRLRTGQYQMILGPDENDDDMADSILQMTEWPDVYRGSRHALALPPGGSILELIALKTATEPDAPLADPAIDASWVTHQAKTDALHLRVVNLGMVPISNVRLRLFADGKLLRLEQIALLPASTSRKLGQVEIQYPLVSTLGNCRLTVKLEVTGPEGSDQNNTLSLTLHPGSPGSPRKFPLKHLEFSVIPRKRLC